MPEANYLLGAIYSAIKMSVYLMLIKKKFEDTKAIIRTSKLTKDGK
jgi:hypothetical protein